MKVFIFILTVACLVFVSGLLFAVWRKQRPSETTEFHGEEIDGIREYDNPLPGWWTVMFVGLIIFAIFYLVAYPGVWKGVLGWTSANEHSRSVDKAAQNYGPIFNSYLDKSFDEILAEDNQRGLKMGQRLFQNNCSVCHGIAGQGAYGFPNLTDGDWIYGPEPETILDVITNGRYPNMPAGGLKALKGDDINAVAHYVRSMSGNGDADPALIEVGKPLYAEGCALCHGNEGKGSYLTSGDSQTGAPNLTDEIWLYGRGEDPGSIDQIKQTLYSGRAGVMPAHKNILSEAKIRLVSAYVWSLSQEDE